MVSVCMERDNVIYGVGVDLVNLSRMERALERWGERFRGMVFGREELEYAATKKHPAQHLAACFAAKEAVIKALGLTTGLGLRFSQIQVTHEESGAPRVALSGAAAERAGELGVQRMHLSLSHDRGYAVAMVVAETL